MIGRAEAADGSPAPRPAPGVGRLAGRVGRAGRSLTSLVVAAALALGPSAAGATTPRFEDRTAASGLDFVHVRAHEVRFWFPEIMSGGAAWLDYDGDGDLDLYAVQGGEIDPARPRPAVNRLFRNDGGRFRDVTAASGSGDPGYGMGAAVGDYDGDGDPDLYVTNVGPNVLLRNEGDGTFHDVTAAAGVGHPGWGTSAAWLDYDGDLDLDLFVVNYVHWSPENEIECSSGGHARDYCHPSNYNAPAVDTLYRNDGDGGFTEQTAAAGLESAFGNGLGVAVADFDRDGRPDLYVANDGMPNQLWMNRGGRFEDEALVSGSAVNRAGAPEAGMGVAIADLEGDSDLELFVTHLRSETNTLYVSQGDWFDDQTAGRGLAAPSVSLTGFGTAFHDFDQDGRLDLLVVNGRVGRGEASIVEDDPFAEPNQLFHGLADGGFAETAAGVESPIENSRAAAFGDYDGDGDVDVAVVNNGGRLRLFANRGDSGGGGWLRARVLGAAGGDLPGARIAIRAGGDRRERLAETAYSYCAANDPAAHFGLGDAAVVDELELTRPDGARQRWRSLPADRSLVLYPPGRQAS